MTDTVVARLRIDDLARRSGIASGTIRFYQREGLIPPPVREGRVAYYGEEHVRRLERVRALKEQGLPLAVVGDLLARADQGQDISPWLALDRAVFRPQRGDEVAPGALDRMGLAPADVAALVRAGVLRRRDDGGLEALPGMLELTSRLVEAGVPPAAIRAGAEVVADRLRDVARTMADLGWDLFADDLAGLAASDGVPEEVLVRYEFLRSLAQRIVATLFPRLLDEAIRARTEPFAAEVAIRPGDLE